MTEFCDRGDEYLVFITVFSPIQSPQQLSPLRINHSLARERKLNVEIHQE
jgi:hypothetical protein